jgi:predicted Zn-dependent protease
MLTPRQHGLPIALLCACMTSLARAAILPTDLEARIGADYQPVDADERAIWQNLQGVEEAIRTSPQRLIAPDLEAYTRRVVERLIGRPAPDLRIYLMRDASFNAAMLPTGMMIVNTGLLVRVRNEAQFAAVLGHEAGHYFRKHSLDRYRDIRHKSERSAAVVAAGGMTGIGHRAIDPSWSLIYQATLMSIFKFSRGQESEADAYGLMLMARAGYPPRAAFAMWEQLVDERRASAAARDKRYRDGTSSALSTHPPTEGRITDLTDTADHLAAKGELPGGEGRDEWAAAIRPYLAMLLQEQIYLNDPGASLYLLANLAQAGWTGLLRFNEGEVYRLRNAKGDDLKAAAAYAAATALADAPPETWRAHGYALLKAGNRAEAYRALNRYLAMKPDAPDAAMIRFTLISADETEVTGRRMTVDPAPREHEPDPVGRGVDLEWAAARQDGPGRRIARWQSDHFSGQERPSTGAGVARRHDGAGPHVDGRGLVSRQRRHGVRLRLRRAGRFSRRRRRQAALQLCVGNWIYEAGQLRDARRRSEAVRDQTRGRCE